MMSSKNWIAFIFSFLALIFISTHLSHAQPSSQLSRFTGRYIATLSDGDFLASTYVNGKLPAPGVHDQLSIVNLPLSGKRETIVQTNASNSVIGAPYALALSSDSQTAFVVETLGAMPVGATRREQLPPGNQLVAIDLSNPRRPNVQSRIAVAPNPKRFMFTQTEIYWQFRRKHPVKKSPWFRFRIINWVNRSNSHSNS
ncbi:MAG: hypothetical protein HC936_02960 [Leptolyngbyaceae cyanobacterium SU_3_3]|nr:hypothetical protein [Leptolyngbyaceae cyanobacterium SU_3_3]